MTASTTDDLASAERRIQELSKELSQARDELAQAKGELVEAREQQTATTEANTRLFEEVQTRNTELRAAVEQQTATSDILRVIGSSPTDLQPVFDTIVQKAKRLLNGYTAGVHIIAGQEANLVAFTTTGELGDVTLKEFRGRPRTLASAPLLAGMVRDLVPRVVSDTETDQRIAPLVREMARVRGYRSLVFVPMVRQGQAIGAIGVTRRDAGTFAGHEIALIKTFADQAVIAIENARLFEAEQASKRELQESLEYQTATAEVLSVISKSPHALQPVLDTIIETAARLCEADYARFRLLRDGAYHVVARLSHDPDPPERHIPLRPGHDSIVGRVALERTTIHIPDVRADPAGGAYALNRRLAARTVLGVPLLKHGNVVGIIVLFRDIPQAFSERQIGLLETFANQATIAIENTRLFEAEQASKRELQESLEYQTAISEVLSIISRSPSELQPVMDAIAFTAKDLCNAYDAALLQRSGDHLSVVSHRGPLLLAGGRPMDRSTVTGRAFR